MAICSDSGNELPASLRCCVSVDIDFFFVNFLKVVAHFLVKHAYHFRHDITKHLLERLGDEDLINRVSAAKLFSQLGNDPLCLP